MDFIETGLKKVLDECNVIDSIGATQVKLSEVVKGKRKRTEKYAEEFESMVRSAKKKKTMGTSVPVIVEIEPNPSIYNTFRKRITGSTEETPEDRMLRLAKSKNTCVNIANDEKYRRTLSQKVTSTAGVYIAKEGDDEAMTVEGSEHSIEYEEPDENDGGEWTPRYIKKGRRGRPKKKPLAKTTTIRIKQEEKTIPPLASVDNPTQPIISNGPHSLTMCDIKAIDTSMSDEEKIKMKELMPTYTHGCLTNSVVNSYLYNLAQRFPVLYLTIEQMEALAANTPYISRYWNVEDVSGPNKKRFVVAPWRNNNRLVAFILDLLNETIIYLDPANLSDESEEYVKTLQSTLAGLMVVEIPFDQTRPAPQTWTLASLEKVIESEAHNYSVRCLWYIYRVCNDMSLSDECADMAIFRNKIYVDVAGHSIDSVIKTI